MKKYLITLTGQGDTNILLVNKKIFEWILSPVEFPLDTSPQKDPFQDFETQVATLDKVFGKALGMSFGTELVDMMKDLSKSMGGQSGIDIPNTVGSIDDPTTPLILQEHMKSRGYEPLCNVTCGSPDNDKALFVLGCADLDDENVRSFGSVRELNKYCKKHKVDIEDEWEGGIY